MYADIKLKGIDVVITVQDVKTIKIKGLHSDQTEEITDFESFAFFLLYQAFVMLQFQLQDFLGRKIMVIQKLYLRL